MPKPAPLWAACVLIIGACTSSSSSPKAPAALGSMAAPESSSGEAAEPDHPDSPEEPTDQPDAPGDPGRSAANPPPSGSPEMPIIPPIKPPEGNPAGEVGSETGNPPVITPDHVYTQNVDGGVQVTGQPGAVEPGGATVEVTNVDSGEVITVQSNPDGSFTVMFKGDTPAGVSIRVSDEHGSSMPLVLSVERTTNVGTTRTSGAMDAGMPTPSESADASIPVCPNPPCLSVERAPLPCGDRQMQADNMLNAALSEADLTCATAADCVSVTLSTQCHARCSGSLVVSRGAQADLDALVSRLDRTLCGGDYSTTCNEQTDSCTEGPEPAAACESGKCTLAR